MINYLKKGNRLLKKRIKKALVGIGKKHNWFMVIYRKLLFKRGRRKYMKYYNEFSVNDKMVLFEAFMGRQFACSPKEVYLRMLSDERFKDYTFVWAFKRPKAFAYLANNRNTIIVKYGSREFYEYYAQAKFWITNSRLKDIIKKKDNQVYIQCWHGTPLKKLAYDIEVSGDNALHTKDDLLKTYSDDAERYTYMISPSEFCTEKFASAFNLPDKSIIRTIGYPRNDFLFNYTPEDVDAIKTKIAIKNIIKTSSVSDLNSIKYKLNIDKSKKIILYAPTWRDNQHVTGQGYTYDLNIDFGRLMEEFGNEYIILSRAHYFISNNIDLSAYEGFVYDVSKYDDINELYIVSDILITDYSSVFFDFANLKKPILFYMYDFEEYKNNMRDFYIDLSELPGPIVKTEDDLISEIKGIDGYSLKYSDIYSTFNAKFNYLDDGDASLRLIEECILN